MPSCLQTDCVPWLQTLTEWIINWNLIYRVSCLFWPFSLNLRDVNSFPAPEMRLSLESSLTGELLVRDIGRWLSNLSKLLLSLGLRKIIVAILSPSIFSCIEEEMHSMQVFKYEQKLEASCESQVWLWRFMEQKLCFFFRNPLIILALFNNGIQLACLILYGVK